MKIDATVYKPLSIETSGDIDYGIVAPGSDVTKFAKVFLKGEEAAIVRIEVDGAQKYDSTSYKVELKSSDGKEKLPVYFNFNSGGYFIYDRVRLNWDGTSKFDMSTRLIVPNNQKSGKYTTKITLKARYD